jgi:TonB family protein
VGQPEKRAPESAPPELRAPRVEVHLRPINVPSVSVPNISATPSVDSIVRSATERPRAPDTGRTGTGDRVSVPASADVDRADADKPITPAKIIGRIPEPRFPEALRSRQREGQVVVRFIVDELGRVDVASMIVEQSDHELFTAAVRDILPLFRFEPARTQAPESKPVARWVSVPFRFTTKR